MKRILIIRLDFIGDLVVTTPFIKALHDKYPQAEIYALTNYYNQQVLSDNPHLKAVYSYSYCKRYQRNKDKRFWPSVWLRLKMIYEFRKLKFDLVVIPNARRDRRAIQFAKLLGAKTLRYNDGKTYFNDDNPEHVATKELIHEALIGFKLMPELIQPTIESLAPEVFPKQQLIESWQATHPKQHKPRIGMFVSQKAASRTWPQEKWESLAYKLSEDYEIMVISNNPDDKKSAWQGNTPFIYPKTENIEQLVALMRTMDYVICTDSAPLHFASALSIPVVGLFENRIEKLTRWHPLNTEYELVFNKQEIRSIEVNQVYQALLTLAEKVKSL